MKSRNGFYSTSIERRDQSLCRVRESVTCFVRGSGYGESSDDHDQEFFQRYAVIIRMAAGH